MSAEKILFPTIPLNKNLFGDEGNGFPLFVLRGLVAEQDQNSATQDTPETVSGDIFRGRPVLLFTPYLYTQHTEHQSSMLFATRQQALAQGVLTESWGRHAGNDVQVRTVVTTHLTEAQAAQAEQSGISVSAVTGSQVVLSDNQKERAKTIAHIRAANQSNLL